MNIEVLKEELRQITEQKKFVLNELSNYSDLLDKTLVLKKSNGIYQYYYRDADDDLEYISAADKDIAKRLAQKDYYEKMLTNLHRQEMAIKRFILKYNCASVSNLYEKLSDGRKQLINPIIKSDADYIKEWYEKYCGAQNKYDKSSSYTTNNGEEVRSKSEKILADLFYQYGVIYQYEPEIILHNGIKCYPDFVLLNLRERKTYFWEHFGLTSDNTYSDKNLEKLARYEKSGIISGENLIISTEAYGINLDVNLIEHKIKLFLL